MDLNEALVRLNALHPRTLRRKMVRQNEVLDLDAMQAVMLSNIRCGGLDFLELYRACMRASLMPMEGGDKFLLRPLKALVLLRLFEKTVVNRVAGGYIECGVFRGFSALLLARAAREHRPGYDGSDFYLVDSFEGLSPSTDHDQAVWVDPDGNKIRHGTANERFTGNKLDHVSRVFEEFPETTLCKGWIPTVFDQLPVQDWAFVHVDVDLYEPTRDSLVYFWDKLAPGGVIVCDDYVTPMFPGAMKAWDEFCEARGLPFLILDTGQAVLERPV